MKAAEEVGQVEPERRKRDLVEPDNSGWFTESFVNICKFGLSFRFIEESRSLKLHLMYCGQPYTALRAVVKLVLLLVIAFLT